MKELFKRKFKGKFPKSKAHAEEYLKQAIGSSAENVNKLLEEERL